MKKLLLLLLCLPITLTALMAQCDATSTPIIKFSGQAPTPWSINGQTNDWSTIFGQFTGNPEAPYSSLNRANYAAENITAIDQDHPNPTSDIRFTGYTYDSYNVYFYVRRLENGGTPVAYFYFFDVNMDGFMNTGEPVVSAKSAGAAPMDLYQYIPNTSVAFESGKGNRMYSESGFSVDGYSMPGSVTKLFSSNQIPAAFSLLPGEQLKAQVTENGAGLEMAIPWRYLRNWSVPTSTPLVAGNAFTFHLSSYEGKVKKTEEYSPEFVGDNIGNCCKGLSYVEIAKQVVISQTQQSIGQWTKRFLITVSNTMNAKEQMGIYGIGFSQLQLNNSVPFTISDIKVYVDGNEFMYELSFQNFINFSGPVNTANPGSSVVFTVDVVFPSNGAVLSAQTTIIPRKPSFGLPIYCQIELGGGPGNPPIIFDVTTEGADQLKSATTSKVSGGRELKVYPNPSNGSATVSIPFTERKTNVTVEDISGRIVREFRKQSATLLKLENLKPGLYLVRMTEADGNSKTVKLVVQ